MSSLDRVILMITISIAFLTTAEGAACNSSALQTCFEELLNSELLSSGLLTKETLQKACKSYEAVTNCTNNTGCLDDPTIGAFIRGFQNSFDEICQELNIELFLSHGNCLESNEVKQAGHQCAQQEQGDTNQQYRECEVKSRFLSCIVSSVGVHCGSEAGNLCGNFLVKLFQPAMTLLFQCQLQLNTEVETTMLRESTAMLADMTTVMTTDMSTATSIATSIAMTETTHSNNGSNCLRSLSIIYELMFIMLLLKPPDVFKL